VNFDLQRLRARVERALWSRPDSGLPLWKKRAMRAARLLVVVVRDVVAGDLTLWTMSLVYTTLLSMVPLLALSFSVLKAFGVHNQVEPLLESLLAPLGPQGDVISSRLVEFIERMNVGVLGAVGLALLVYTVISLMQKIEESFNSIWHVTQLRRLADRFSRYLSAVLIGPMLVFAALSLTAAAMSSEIAKALVEVEPFGTIVVAASEIAPYALVIGAFTLLYRFIPNTRVGWMPALLGALVGGVLWQSAG
jgi:membrane protein